MLFDRAKYKIKTKSSDLDLASKLIAIMTRWTINKLEKPITKVLNLVTIMLCLNYVLGGRRIGVVFPTIPGVDEASH
jgi:hypothetical protein